MSDAAYNPELSWLSFNWRVLAMAMDPSSPLFEKLRFLVCTLALLHSHSHLTPQRSSPCPL